MPVADVTPALLPLPDLPAGVPRHPAKFGPDIMAVIGRHARGRVLDPFAGIGRIHAIAGLGDVTTTTGVELEPEWAAAHPSTIVGNALALPYRAATFDTIATSPCYGNRMADHHEAHDGSRRYSYTHCLGRSLHPESSGLLGFGERYRRFHVQAWDEARRVLRPGGLFIVNVADFMRRGQTMPVVSFHRMALGRLGLALIHEIYLPKRGLRDGANRGERTPHEVVLVLSYGPARKAGLRRRPRPRPSNVIPLPQVPGQLSMFGGDDDAAG